MRFPLLAFLSGVLLLASCGTTSGGTSGSTAGSGTTGGMTTPVTTSSAISVTRAITLGLSDTSQAEIQVATTGSATAQLLSAPAGLSVTIGTPARLSSGDLSIPLTYSGSASSGEVVRVSVTTGGQTSTVTVPVYSFGTLAIAAPGLSASYPAASLRLLSDGTALLMAGANGNVTERQNLLRLGAGSQQFSLLPFGLALSGETITSQTTAPDGNNPDGKIWVTVRGLSAKGSYLVSQDSSGRNTVYWAGAAGDNVNNAASTADGRIWFTQYTSAAIKALTPSSGDLQSFAVTDKADSLVRGADGKLYYAAFFTQPAIVQLDPASPATPRTFAVGEANHSLPTALQAAPDGSIWFIEARGGTVWRLDPATGKQVALTLPSGAHPNALAVGANGQVWVLDATSAMLYTTASVPSAPTSAVIGVKTLPLPSAPAAASDGKIWYVAGGQLVRQQ